MSQPVDYTHRAYGGTGAPTLTIGKSHFGNFTQGGTGTYTIVSNNGTAGTSGPVTVTDTLPGGLSFSAMSGSGWSCTPPSCTRSDSPIVNGSYPAITVTVNVTGTAPSSVTNQAIVSGGGSGSNTANDVTTIGPAGLLSNPSFESGSPHRCPVHSFNPACPRPLPDG